jgi:hypothetical protein
MSQENNKHRLVFTDDQMALAAFQLSMENNALLRIMLGNQIAIMQRLDLEPRIFSEVWNELFPEHEYDATNPIDKLLMGTELITSLLEKRAWEWSTLNVDIKIAGRGEDPYQSMRDEE